MVPVPFIIMENISTAPMTLDVIQSSTIWYHTEEYNGKNIPSMKELI